MPNIQLESDSFRDLTNNNRSDGLKSSTSRNIGTLTRFSKGESNDGETNDGEFPSINIKINKAAGAAYVGN